MNHQRHRPTDLVVAAAVFAIAFLYRFNALGGAFGGFTNDEFGYLARARQIQAGQVPFRDFNDPGWFLTDALSAAAQWAWGYNLRSQALLTVGALSIAAALTFLLARRASGSYVAALVAVAVQVALEPRHYNYPKLILYAAGLMLSWAYLDRASTGRLIALGALVGVGFLFRHDHLVYLGLLAVTTIGLAHRASIATGVRAVAVMALVTAAFVAPFLGFLVVNGGIGEYFRAALVYVQRDAERTSFSVPVFSYDPAKPLVAITRPAPAATARVSVRWHAIGDSERRQLEERYRLDAGEPDGGTTWRYTLRDVSSENIQRLVRDARIEDTHGVDRATFTVTEDRSLRLESQFQSLQNATATLYYLFLLLPVIAALVAIMCRNASGTTQAIMPFPYMVPVILLASVLAIGFLSRGSTNIRIPDVGVTVAVLLAWLMPLTLGRGGRALSPRPLTRWLVRIGAAGVLAVTVLSVHGLAHPLQTLHDAGLSQGPARVGHQTRAVWSSLGQSPPVFAEGPEQPELLKVAAYIHRCTAPTDRLFVLGHYPELYYFADRRFAGGHAWLLPFYYSEGADEDRIVARLKQVPVPIVITDRRKEYEEEYAPVFESVDAYLKSAYAEAGEVSVGNTFVRILVRKGVDSKPDAALHLPCFTSPAVPASS